MKNTFNKVIVAHPGKQHSFRMATALKKHGILLKYITTVYDKKKSYTILLKKWLKGDNLKRASTRRCEDLFDDDVLQFYELLGLILLLLNRIDKSRLFYNKLEKTISNKFGKKIAKYAISNKVDAIVVYDTNALSVGRYLKKMHSNIKLIMDVSAANRDYMKVIYEEDMKICPAFSNKLLSERDYLRKNNELSRFNEELTYIDYFIVPSQFVKTSLMYSNIKPQQVYVCPFGSNFTPVESKWTNNSNGSLSLVYIGNVTALKGVWYMLEAIMNFSKEQVTLKLIGNFDNSTGIFDPYLDRCEFVGLVTHDKVQELCLNSDVFIFPSLGEGMSLAALEALSFGLPCIVTENSGINDFIVDEYNGFVIPIQSVESIQEKVQWFLDNRPKISEMSNNALETAKILSWENYYENMKQTMEMIYKDVANVRK